MDDEKCYRAIVVNVVVQTANDIAGSRVGIDIEAIVFTGTSGQARRAVIIG